MGTLALSTRLILCWSQAGAQPATDEVWLIEVDGRQFGLMRDARAWQRIQDNLPDVELVSDREIGLALIMYKHSITGKALDELRKVQAGAEIINLSVRQVEDDPEDPIPF